MRGDPGGTVLCPLCGDERTASRSYRSMSTHATLASVFRQHVLEDHPELGPRDRSLLVDVATCAHHVTTPILESWTADGPRPFQCLDCGATL